MCVDTKHIYEGAKLLCTVALEDTSYTMGEVYTVTDDDYHDQVLDIMHKHTDHIKVTNDVTFHIWDRPAVIHSVAKDGKPCDVQFISFDILPKEEQFKILMTGKR